MEILNGVQQTDQNKAWLNGARDTSGDPFGLNEYLNGIRQTEGGVTTVYDDAISAWSVLDLGTGYSGNVIRVRENSGENEEDFGFVGGTLNVAGIEAHLDIDTPNADGFVVTLFDLIGANDMTQSTASNQFKIGSAGTVLTNADGDVAIQGSTSTSLRLLNASPPSLGMSDFTIHTIIQSDVQGTYRRFFDLSGGGAICAGYIRSDGTLQIQIKDEDLNQVLFTTGSMNLEDDLVHKITYTISRVDDMVRCYADGAEENNGSIATVTGNMSMSNWRIGTNGGNRWWEYISTVAIWDRELTADEVASL